MANCNLKTLSFFTKHKWYSFVLLFLISRLLVPQHVQAEEVDDFTPVPNVPKDASAVINMATNSLIEELVDKLNIQEMLSCNNPEKYTMAIKKLDQNFTAIGNGLRAGPQIRQLLDLIKKNPEHSDDYFKRIADLQNTWLAEFAVDQRQWYSELFSSVEYFGRTENETSIYKGLDYLTCCTHRINVAGIYVGLDKIDHFFGNAGLLFEQYLKNKSQFSENENLKTIMKTNVRQEHSLWGLNGLSPKSYGDLAANWLGFRFYQSIFDGKKPLILCQHGRFEKNPKIKFAIEHFLDESWNESYNCSSFATEKERDLFQKNLTRAHLKCPMRTKVCDQLRKKHQNDHLFIDYALSPLCKGSQAPADLIEPKEKVTWDEVELSFRGFTKSIVAELLDRKITQAIYSLFPSLLKPATIKALNYQKEQEGAASTTFSSMQKCIQSSKEESLQCLQEFTEPGIQINQLDKFYDSLIQYPLLSNAKECDQATQNYYRLLHPTPIGDLNLCFANYSKYPASLGQVFFRKHNNEYKVILMRF